ncbi:hypothetical protein BCON_0243g00130 [Botryotinia convoluta]|uniref:BTB domain-containing protein n=1 Tax=Botryotinia convoluta TaxID=54673 RepID=A0A4Z1HID9_9HELO|nr:hypothetical protein BCON_0243g00130 [Botryotinia convoluta]
MSNSEPALSAITDKTFRQRTGVDMVHLYVGEEKEHFRVHKAILCDKIPYFEKIFKDGGFIESLTSTAYFPEDHASTFDILIEWAYTGMLPPICLAPRDKVLRWDFGEFYILLDKLCLFDLMDEAMDMFRKTENYTDEHYAGEDMIILYSRLYQDSPLRRYLLDCLLYRFSQKGENVEDLWSPTSMDVIFEAEDNLAIDYLETLRTSYGEEMPDPTIGDDCIYHCHKEMERRSQSKSPIPLPPQSNL